jgi:hypothetical protein
LVAVLLLSACGLTKEKLGMTRKIDDTQRVLVVPPAD